MTCIMPASPTSRCAVLALLYDVQLRHASLTRDRAPLQAWAWQKQAVEDAIAASQAGSGRDAVFLLQHPPVYTLGAGSTEDHVRFDPATSRIPLYRTERGGEVTYHGPGQLVMYPVLDLQAHTPDLHWYLRSLEEVVIRSLDAVSGLRGERVEGLTGVWVAGAKVAAVGIRAKKWVTYHGLALNVAPDLAPFADIVPCGIAGRPVTSVAQLLGGATSAAAGDAELLLQEYSFALLDAFAEVFGLEMAPGDSSAWLEHSLSSRSTGLPLQQGTLTAPSAPALPQLKALASPTPDGVSILH